MVIEGLNGGSVVLRERYARGDENVGREDAETAEMRGRICVLTRKKKVVDSDEARHCVGVRREDSRQYKCVFHCRRMDKPPNGEFHKRNRPWAVIDCFSVRFSRFAHGKSCPHPGAEALLNYSRPPRHQDTKIPRSDKKQENQSLIEER